MQEPESNFLRLFPLGALVLFPGMELPLTVFEPRYVQLTSECTDAEEPFGVLLLKEGSEVGDQGVEPYEIGTTAHILNVTDAGHGRLSVMAVGGQRFRVRSFSHEHPYLAAEVEYLNDDSAALVEPSLVANVKEDAVAFVRALMAMRGGFIRDVPLPDDPTSLSYQVAQFFQGDATVQQRLLERETFDRLWDELDLIKGAMRRVIQRERRQGPGQSFSAN
jgi:Lon protease-like protein